MSIIKRKAGSVDLVKSVLEFDEVPTEGSHNLVESGAVAEALANGGKIAVFEVNLGHGMQYPAFNDVKGAVDSGKVPVLHIINYNGTSDSPADYFYLVNYNSAPNYHSYSFSNGSSTKTVNSRNEWSDTRASRYTTRTETVTILPGTINVSDGESLLYNVTRLNDYQTHTITAPAGTTDAQVAIISTNNFRRNDLAVSVGGVTIPLFDFSMAAVDLHVDYAYDIVKSLNEPDSNFEPPTSFEEMGIADSVVTGVSAQNDQKTWLKEAVIQIVGHVAFLLGK